MELSPEKLRELLTRVERAVWSVEVVRQDLAALLERAETAARRKLTEGV